MKLFLSSLLLIVFLLPLKAIDMSALRGSMANIVNEVFNEQAQKDRVIAFAAKNKVLSQQMAKDAVMIVSHIKSKQNYAQMLESAKKFNTFLNAIFKGNDTLKIKKATDPLVLKHAHEVLDIWKKFYPFVQSFFQNNKINTYAYNYILNNNEKLLRLSHKLTQTLKSKRVVNTTLNKVVEHSLKIADRQRMLTQKMFKEKLLIFNNTKKARNEIRLKGSIILFENGLKGLLHGDNKRGLIRVTNDEIYKNLQKAWSMWQKVQQIYRDPYPSKEDILKIAEYEPKFLKVSDDLVRSIEESLGIL